VRKNWQTGIFVAAAAVLGILELSYAGWYLARFWAVPVILASVRLAAASQWNPAGSVDAAAVVLLAVLIASVRAGLARPEQMQDSRSTCEARGHDHE
jgi:membrane protein implicated in regulation of membrane protease activity